MHIWVNFLLPWLAFRSSTNRKPHTVTHSDHRLYQRPSIGQSIHLSVRLSICGSIYLLSLLVLCRKWQRWPGPLAPCNIRPLVAWLAARQMWWNWFRQICFFSPSNTHTKKSPVRLRCHAARVHMPKGLGLLLQMLSEDHWLASQDSSPERPRGP